MQYLSKASNVVQSKYILYDITGFTQKCHSIPVATKCTLPTMSHSKNIKYMWYIGNLMRGQQRDERVRALETK